MTADDGSIPACAGEPHGRAVGDVRYEVLSPRVRGNLCGQTAHYLAGVYPRVCGGTP